MLNVGMGYVVLDGSEVLVDAAEGNYYDGNLWE